MNNKRLLLLSLLANLLITISSTGLCEDSTALIKRTQLKQFSIEQGLTQSTIHHFYQSQNGLMWIATHKGLNKLDGVFINQFHGPANILSDRSIHMLKEDSARNLWVASFDTLFRIDKEYTDSQPFQFPNYSKLDNSPNHIIQVFEQSLNQHWIITSKGIFTLNVDEKEIIPFDSMRPLTKKMIRITSAIDMQETIWLGTSSGIYHFNKATHSLEKLRLPIRFNSVPVLKMLKANDNTIFVAAESGMTTINTQLENSADAPLISHQNASAATKLAHTIYYAVKDKIYTYNTFDKKNQHLLTLSQALPGHPNLTIQSLQIDRNKRLWIGTKKQGAYVWTTNNVNYQVLSNITPNRHLKLSNSEVWQFSEDSKGNLWIGTGNGLNYLDLEKSSIASYLVQRAASMQKQATRIFYILPADHILWLGTTNGLIKFNTRSKKHSTFFPSLVSKKATFRVHSMTKVTDDDIWLSTNLGLMRFNPTTEKFHFDTIQKPARSKNKATLIRYHNKQLWIGYKNKLDVYDPLNKTKRTIFKVDSRVNTSAYSLTDFHLNNNQLWIAFNGMGIYAIDLNLSGDNIVKHFNYKNGFIDNTVHSLLPDEQFLWASTQTGLVKFNKSDFSYLVHDYDTGLPINEFNQGASYKTAKGKLLFGGANGFLAVTPANLEEPDKNSAPVIVKISTPNKAYSLNGLNWKQRDIQFSGSDNIIIFSLSMLDFLTPHKWHYEYWLTGKRTTTATRIANEQFVISNLDSGNYTLNIRASLPGYSQFNKITKLPFKINRNSGFQLNLESTLYASFAILITLLSLWISYQKKRSNWILQNENKQLKNKQKRLELSIFSELNGVWEWQHNGQDIESSIITIFMAYEETTTSTIAQHLSDIHPDDVEYVRQKWHNFLTGNTTTIVCRYRLYFFEKWIYCQIAGKISQKSPQGVILKANGSWANITQKAIRHEKLYLYQKAFQSTRDIIFILNSKLNIISVNRAYKRQTGFSSHYLIGQSIIKIAQNRLAHKITSRLINQIKENKSWQGEASMPRKNASSYPIDIRIDAIKSNENKQMYVIIMSESSALNHNHESSNKVYHDMLTGLPNLALAKDRLSHITTHAKLQKKTVILAHIDLNNFNFYSQSLGKNTAKEILINASNQILPLLNRMDTLARVGLHEFYIIFENIEAIDSTTFQLETIISKLNSPQIIENSVVNMSVSVGVSCFPEDATTVKDLRKMAKTALKQTKFSDKNRINYYNKSINNKVLQRFTMKKAIQSALANNQFFVVFQPKYQLKLKKIIGFELLARWKTNSGNIIYPSQFIQLAEEIGIIENLNQWVIEQAINTLIRWKKENINTCFSLKLIPQHCQRVGLGEHLLEIINKNNLSPESLQIEISQTHYSENIRYSHAFIADLKGRGFNVILSHFGAGDTALNYLKNTPIHTLQLDRNFTRKIGNDKYSEKLTKLIITFINELGIVSSAKGIETQEQLDFLINAGCQVGQGYLFSEPLIESDAKALMATSVK